MPFRTILLPAVGFGAAACWVFLVASSELPKEGTWHSKSTMSAKHTLNRIGEKGALIVVGEGTGTVIADWGQGERPPMKEHCFELSAQKDWNTVVQLMYCIDTDQDGDQLVWKLAAEDLKDLHFNLTDRPTS